MARCLRVANRRILFAGSGRSAEETISSETLSAFTPVSRCRQIVGTLRIVSAVVDDVATHLRSRAENTVTFIPCTTLAAVLQSIPVVHAIRVGVAIVDDVASGL